ncbi:hypothetical protein [Bacillus coreaensis]
MILQELIQWAKDEYESARKQYMKNGDDYWFGRMNAFKEILNHHRVELSDTSKYCCKVIN